MTVMFVDLVGSTSIAERHEPEVVRDVVRRYQELCGRAVGERGGHIAKYSGDGMMVYFGFPTAHEDDARQATLAGLDIVDGLNALSSKVRAEHGIDLAARVGIHTGLVLLAEMGAHDRPERDAVVGATPNQAARIEAVAPSGTVAISAATHEIVRGYVEVESLGRPEMKGLTGDVEVFRVLRPTQASDRLQAAGRALTPFVGRRDELQSVREHWAALGESTSCPTRIVLLRGEAGIGKSRVAAQMVREALADGHPLFLAMCSADRRTSPLYPIVRLLESHFGFEPGDDDGTKLDRLEQGCAAAALALADAVPVLAALLELPTAGRYEPLQLDPSVVRVKTFEVIAALVLARAGRKRTLMVVEDLQWSDQSTLELFGRLAATSSAQGLLVMATTRPEFERPWREGCCFTIGIGRLPPSDHQELIRQLADIHAVSQDVWHVVAQRSDGNPLFTEELARAVNRGGDDRASVDSVPMTIRDLLTARLDAVGPHKHLAQVAATIGREVDVDLLRTVTALSRRQLVAGMTALAQAGILEQLGRPEGNVTHRFVHALVRDAAYDSQERLHDRPAAHLGVARALIGRPGSDAGIVAQHFDAAGSVGDAVQYYLLAAMVAQGAAAHIEAIRRLDRALELTSSLPDGQARDGVEINVRILRGLSTVITQGYAAPAAADDYRRGLELSGRAGTDLALFTATMGIWSFYAVHGDHRAAAEAVARLETMRQPEVEAEFLACTGVQWFFEGRFAKSRTAMDAALAAFDRRPPDQVVSRRWQLPTDPFVVALTNLGPLLWLGGEPEDARAVMERACQRAAILPFPSGPTSQGYAMSYAGWLANLDGRFTDGLELQQRMLEISERHGLAFWTAIAMCHAAISQAHLGDPEAGADSLAAGIARWRALGAEAFVPCLLTHLAEIRFDLGAIDNALGDVERALECAEATGELFFMAESHRIRAGILRHQGSAAADVRRELESSRSIAADQDALVFELRALIDLVQLEDAHQHPADVHDLRVLVERLPAAARPVAEVAQARLLLTGTGDSGTG